MYIILVKKNNFILSFIFIGGWLKRLNVFIYLIKNKVI